MIPEAAFTLAWVFFIEARRWVILVVVGGWLYNNRNAEFHHHEVPSMIIPIKQRERMTQAKKPKQEGGLIA